jgi:glutaredoxin
LYAFASLVPRLDSLDRAMRLTLYQRDDCKLCDEAIALLARVRVPDFESVWIDGDAELETRYGVRVPVLRDDASGRELGWPFDIAALQAFLSTIERETDSGSHCVRPE